MVLPLSCILLSHLIFVELSSFWSRTAAQELDQLSSLAKHAACAANCAMCCPGWETESEQTCKLRWNALKYIILQACFFHMFFPMTTSFTFFIFLLDLRHITNRKVRDVSIPYLDPFEGLARDMDREESCWAAARSNVHVHVISSRPPRPSTAIGAPKRVASAGHTFFRDGPFWPCRFEMIWDVTSCSKHNLCAMFHDAVGLCWLHWQVYSGGGAGRANKCNKRVLAIFWGSEEDESDARPHFLISEVRNPDLRCRTFETDIKHQKTTYNETWRYAANATCALCLLSECGVPRIGGCGYLWTIETTMVLLWNTAASLFFFD